MSIINYAHRGASEYCPENTMYSFYTGLQMGADGVETDVQRTRDGVLVLFHDDTLQRILGLDGKISDYTYSELLTMDFGAYKGERFRGETIVTLDEFLIHFGAKPLTLALELKQDGVEEELLSLIRRHGVQEKVIVTAFRWDALVQMRRLDPDIRLGFLVEEATEETFQLLQRFHIQQICPHIDHFSEAQIARARDLGLSIRFWGVANEEKMRRALRSDCDGMTFNAPDLLARALQDACPIRA